MHRRIWSRWSTTVVVVLVGWIAACSDEVATAPRFERPTGTVVGLDRTKRLPKHGELGGAAAMAAISDRFGAASANSSDPLERAVAEWRAKQGVVSGPRSSKLWSGVEQYDGDYYVWESGESYAPLAKQAKIYNLFGDVGRVGDGPVDIDVTFDFDGHRADNIASWDITRSNGEKLISRPASTFGSPTEPFLGFTFFAKRGWAATASEYVTGCDVVINGGTRAIAWYELGWDLNGLSIGINPDGSGFGLTFTRRKSGSAEASKPLKTYFTCPPPEEGGGDTGYGGGDDCFICQQWFLPIGDDWMVEWWECDPAGPSECEEFVT